MANTPVLPAPDWDAIRLSSIRGVTDDELAAQYGIRRNTIEVRRFRDPVWAAAFSRGGRPQDNVRLTQNTTAKQVKENVEVSMETIRAENPLLVARHVHKLVKKAVETDQIPVPSTMAELKMASELVRKNVGLDKEGGSVTLNMWSGGGFDGFRVAEPATAYELPVSPATVAEEWE